MSKFKKKKSGDQPAISTASLPDIVFMLLFFFMVTTVMREVDLKIEVKNYSRRLGDPPILVASPNKAK